MEHGKHLLALALHYYMKIAKKTAPILLTSKYKRRQIALFAPSFKTYLRRYLEDTIPPCQRFGFLCCMHAISPKE